ncbi:hypothetical protein EI94DRAFT_1743210 [Lactarius quietus]|nr:hypothetical protein EI94DRAFT_1743210 [Lactarius quietus]
MMWQLCCVLSLSSLLAVTLFVHPSSSSSSDGPLQAAFRTQSGISAERSDVVGWNLPPHPNSTHHLIFNSVSGLLQRWPNTFRRNGHSLVPATVPKGTILYHGRTEDQIPKSPDWVAFDFEHAYVFCIFGPSYVISFQARRDLRLVYFDGSSVALMKDGPLDSQHVIVWGRPRPDKSDSYWEHIKVLCDWGRPLGLDGFVRMGYHFEVMICDFLDAMEVVTFLNLLPRNLTTLPGIPSPMPPSGWRGSLPNISRTFPEAHHAGSWHDHAPGETRVRLDYSGLVTFYDPSLSSLVEARYGKDRLHLRLEGISVLDSEKVRAELQSVLAREQAGGSGIDWGSISQVIMERYGGRLEYLRFLLSSSTTTFGDTLERAAVAPDVPKQLPASSNLSWAAPIARRCTTTQTSHISLAILTPQEVRIHAAVENTLHEICRRLVLVWVEFFDVEAADKAGATDAIEAAHGHIDELMSWLEWSVWVRCEPGCSFGEICYLPTYPFTILGGEPYDMTPRCISIYDGTPR